MKRRSWFLGLFVPLAAQNIGESSSSNCLYDGRDGRLLTPGCQNTHRDAKGVVTNSLVPTRMQVKPRPINNECPVCGTMAKPYLREDEVANFKAQGLIFTVDQIRKENLTRCGHCSSAFYQDASA